MTTQPVEDGTTVPAGQPVQQPLPSPFAPVGGTPSTGNTTTFSPPPAPPAPAGDAAVGAGFEINWDEEPQGFDPIPVGPYRATVTGAELKPSQNSPFPYINVEFTVSDGPHAKRKVWDIWSLSPKALPFNVRRYLPRLGITGSGNQQFSSADQLAAWVIPNILNRSCVIVVKHEDYNGSTYDKVKDILPANAALPAAGGSSNQLGL